MLYAIDAQTGKDILSELNVLIAQSLNGNVRLTVREHSGQGDDLNLIHPSDSVHADQNENAILIAQSAKLKELTVAARRRGFQTLADVALRYPGLDLTPYGAPANVQAAATSVTL